MHSFFEKKYRKGAPGFAADLIWPIE